MDRKYISKKERNNCNIKYLDIRKLNSPKRFKIKLNDKIFIINGKERNFYYIL